MGGGLFHDSGYKLTDLLSSAGATIGVIIAGTIFLQFMNTKYSNLCSRYRELADEYRGRREDEPRHDPLRGEIQLYRRRLRSMNRASGLAAVALLCFLLAVLAGGLSLLYPPQKSLKYVGTGGLFAGLVLIGGAVSQELYEIVLARHELGAETADLDDHAREG